MYSITIPGQNVQQESHHGFKGFKRITLTASLQSLSKCKTSIQGVQGQATGYHP